MVVVYSLSCSNSCDPMDCSPLAPLSMGFSRQECWSGLPFLFPGDLLDPRTEAMCPALTSRLFTFWATNSFRRNRRHKMLPVKVENKYKDLIYKQEETNKKSLRKRRHLLLYMLHIKHIQILLYFVCFWYWISSLYSNCFFSSWDIQIIRCSMS